MNRDPIIGAAGRLLALPIAAYRLLASPLFPPRCRFLPSCSEYAIEALHRHGAGRGLALALTRLARCHPWGGSGWDPVPETMCHRRSPQRGRG